MHGLLGFSGRLSSVSQKDKAAVAGLIAFYKQWREFIYSAVVVPLTAQGRRDDVTGWTARHAFRADYAKSLVFAYRMEDSNGAMPFRLPLLKEDKVYVVKSYEQPDMCEIINGAELIDHGLQARIPEVYGGAIYILEEVGQ